MSAKSVLRFVVEVRREIKWFEFEDVRGRLIDLGVKHGFTKVSTQADKIVLADKDLDYKIFVSTDNVGSQIERLSFAESIDDDLEKFYGYLSDSLLKNRLSGEKFRVGTKLAIYYSPANLNFNKIKRAFKDKVYPNLYNFEDGLGIRVDDTALAAFEMKHAGGSLNINTGPVTNDEAIAKFFQEPSYKEVMIRDAGFFAEFDYFRTDLEIDGLDDMKLEVKANLAEVKDLCERFEVMFKDVR